MAPLHHASSQNCLPFPSPLALMRTQTSQLAYIYKWYHALVLALHLEALRGNTCYSSCTRNPLLASINLAPVKAVCAIQYTIVGPRLARSTDVRTAHTLIALHPFDRGMRLVVFCIGTVEV